MSISGELIGSAFIMGLAGSLHCIGMCGPLALTLPISHNSRWSRIAGGLIYNTGRILSYSMMGLVFGSLGNLVIVTKWQNSVSIFLGAIILLYILIPKKYFHITTAATISKPFILLRQQLGKLFQSKKHSSIFSIGILNGFLPCGLVYLALTSSVFSASLVNGGLFMMFFGLGTFPLMFATILMGNYLNQSIRHKIRGVVPVLLFCIAVLLILRGMNLGIPYISPGFSGNDHEIVECH